MRVNDSHRGGNDLSTPKNTAVGQTKCPFSWLFAPRSRGRSPIARHESHENLLCLPCDETAQVFEPSSDWVASARRPTTSSRHSAETKWTFTAEAALFAVLRPANGRRRVGAAPIMATKTAHETTGGLHTGRTWTGSQCQHPRPALGAVPRRRTNPASMDPWIRMPTPTCPSKTRQRMPRTRKAEDTKGGFDRWRTESALGAIGTGVARGLQAVFAPPVDEIGHRGRPCPANHPTPTTRVRVDPRSRRPDQVDRHRARPAGRHRRPRQSGHGQIRRHNR